MQFVKISDLIIENRQRKKFDEKALATLSESIQTKGLLHPLVVREDGKTLVAGERRLRAIQMLYDLDIPLFCQGERVPDGHVPVTRAMKMTEDNYIEAELEENICREDLTWQEHSEAVRKLHELRAAQKGKQTFTETAKELSELTGKRAHVASVSDAVILAKAKEEYPEVAKAKSIKEAKKIYTKIKQQEKQRELAETIDLSSSDHQLFLGDFRDHLPEPGTIDIILTDPPYGIEANNFGSMAAASHDYEDSPEYFEDLMLDFAEESYRVTKNSAHLYMFCGIENFFSLHDTFSEKGWDVWPRPLIWYKGNQGMLPRPDFGPRYTYECILFANKGEKPVMHTKHDVFLVPGLQRPRFGAEKPVLLYYEILRISSSVGDKVWDPFAGTGPIFAAANALKLKVHATEKDETKFALTKARVGEMMEDLDS